MKYTLAELRGLVEAAQDRLGDRHPDGHGGEDEELFGLVLDTIAVQLAANWDRIYEEDRWPPGLDIATVLKASERSTLVLVPQDFDSTPGEIVEEAELLRGMFGEGQQVVVLPPGTKVHEVPKEGSDSLRIVVVEDMDEAETDAMHTMLREMGVTSGVVVANYSCKVEEIPEDLMAKAGWVRAAPPEPPKPEPAERCDICAGDHFTGDHR